MTKPIKISVQRVRRETIEMEVTFPLYRQASWGGDNYSSEHWWCFTADGYVWAISRTESWNGAGSVKWEIEHERRLPSGTVLDDGSEDVRESLAEEFAAKVAEAAEWLAKCGDSVGHRA